MKLNLSQRYVYEGRFFGPGPTEFDSDDEEDIYKSLKIREERKAKLEKKQSKQSLQDNVTSIEAQVHPDRRGTIAQAEVEQIAAKEDSDEPDNPLTELDETESSRPRRKKAKKDYASMKLSKLRRIGSKREIESSDKMTKDELVDALEKSDE